MLIFDPVASMSNGSPCGPELRLEAPNVRISDLPQATHSALVPTDPSPAVSPTNLIPPFPRP